MKKSLLSMIGNALSVVGVALTPQELENLEHITAIICMIAGLLITIIGSIIIPFIKWWKKAKADGKITEDEIDELGHIVGDGVNDIKEHLDSGKESKKGEK